MSGSVEFRRIEKGWLEAQVYGLHLRGILMLNLCRSMDDPKLWTIEPKPMTGFSKGDAREQFTRDFVDQNELRGPHASLREAKTRLRAAVEQVGGAK